MNIPQHVFRKRRDRLVRRLAGEKIEALLVTDVHNVRYLSGFRGEDSALLVAPGVTLLLTDSRYLEQAEAETQGIRIVLRKKGMMAVASREARKIGVKRLGIEADSMTVAQAEELGKLTRGIEVSSTRGLVQRLRIVKDAWERAAIRRAVQVAEEAFRSILTILKPGLTERQVAKALDHAMEDLGAEGPAFETIVAAGPRSSLPHARPTDRRIRQGDAVLLDWGARVDLYCCDLTRVIFLDKIPPLFQRLYPLVLTAQRRALTQVRPGRRANAIDSVARAYLKAHRHGRYFGHGLGHGVGLQVHEGPALSPSSQTVLKAGMVVTVEPGLYLPGRGGVRIEDLVLVTRTGRRVLTGAPKWPPILLVKR